MADEINRVCPHCGNKMYMDTYRKFWGIQAIAYCNNDACPVKPCTDATTPSNMLAEILAIIGDKE